jgi:hypothetical protein
MPYPCYQCSAETPDGVVFCQQCGAPQIRVAPPAISPPNREDSTVEKESKLAERVVRSATADARSGVGVNRGLARSRALLSALTIVGLMLVPLLMLFFPLWMVLGGVLTVYLYFRKDAGAVLSLGEGARMGLMAGLIAFAIYSTLIGTGLAYDLLALHNGPQLMATLRSHVEQSIAANPNPQARQMAEQFRTPGGLALLLLLAWIFMFLLFLLLGSLGGMLGAWMFGRRGKS